MQIFRMSKILCSCSQLQIYKRENQDRAGLQSRLKRSTFITLRFPDLHVAILPLHEETAGVV